MKAFPILAAAVIWLSQPAFASSVCSNGSLSDYITLGAGGCTVGTNTLSGFTVLSGLTGAQPIPAGDVSLSPSGNTENPGLSISVTASAPAGSTLEVFFTYVISGNPYSSSTITLAGSSHTGDGAVTGIENFCANGIFEPDGVSGCTGTPGSLLTLDGVQNSDTTSFSPAGFLAVTDDLTLDGGLAGSATGGTLNNQFTAVPESGSLLLTSAGFVVAVVIRRKLVQRMCS